MPWGDDERIEPQVETPKRMLRYNGGKPPLSLLPTSLIYAIVKDDPYSKAPYRLLEDTAQVLGFGARKYDAENWRKGGPWKEVLDCALRHMTKLFRGETHDEESGIHHAAHVACNLGFLLEFIETDTPHDNRYNVIITPHKPAAVGSLDIVYDLLLLWKDGGQHAILKSAAWHLAWWYESTLKDEDRAMRPGTSEYAFIKG